jgi:hypothetical protein
VKSGVILLLCVAGLIGLSVPAGAQQATRDELNHDFILDLSGITKQQIYDRTMTWITNNLRYPGAVIAGEDPDVGLIVANGVATMTADGDSVAVSLSFRMSVDVREGKERVRFLNLQISRGADKGWDDIPGEGAWHRGAQKRVVFLARALNEYVKMKGGP